MDDLVFFVQQINGICLGFRGQDIRIIAGSQKSCTNLLAFVYRKCQQVISRANIILQFFSVFSVNILDFYVYVYQFAATYSSYFYSLWYFFGLNETNIQRLTNKHSVKISSALALEFQ